MDLGEQTMDKDLISRIEKIETQVVQLLDYMYELIVVLEIRKYGGDIHKLEITNQKMVLNDLDIPFDEYKTLEAVMKKINSTKTYSCFISSRKYVNLPVENLPYYIFENVWGVGTIKVVIRV